MIVQRMGHLSEEVQCKMQAEPRHFKLYAAHVRLKIGDRNPPFMQRPRVTLKWQFMLGTPAHVQCMRRIQGGALTITRFINGLYAQYERSYLSVFMCGMN